MRLTWDEQGEKLFETGVQKTVLYPLNSDNQYTPGVAWNGVSSVSETPSGAEATSIYADDVKYLNLYSAEQLGGTLQAYMYPDEFEQCDGSAEVATGVTIGQQNRKTFGLCYRTTLGNDTEGNDYGYKLHLLYGCKASPSEKQYQTINDSPEAISFSWTLTTTPVNVSGYKPTSILTVKSTDFKTEEEKARLKALEDVLYGTANSEPRLPLPDEVIAMMNPTGTVTLTFDANGHGTAPEAKTVTKGTAATAPADPVAEGYTFGGWYEEASCTNAFSFATVLNADKTVYAKWTESEG
jgi:uncharacterized repeat protein (TIGR02543 family)